MHLFFSLLCGSLSAYFAYKREKNPYIWFLFGFIFTALGVFALFFITSPKKRAPPLAPSAPVYTLEGPLDKFWYYVDPQTQQSQGPMSKTALSTAWKEGKIDLSTYIWHEDLSDWKPLKETVKREN